MSYYDEEYEYDEDCMINTKTTEKQSGKVKLEIETDVIVSSIITGVKNELKESILATIRSEIVKELKQEIQGAVGNITKEIIQEAFEKETITVGGGWGSKEPPQTFTIKEYAIYLIAESIKTGEIERGKNSYRDQTFKEYFIDKCISPEIIKEIDKRLKGTQNQINENLKKVFESNLEKMMSEVALGVLKTNATYNEIGQKLLGK